MKKSVLIYVYGHVCIALFFSILVCASTAYADSQEGSQYRPYQERVDDRIAESRQLRQNAIAKENGEWFVYSGDSVRQVRRDICDLKKQLKRFQKYLDNHSTDSPLARQEKYKVQDQLLFLFKEVRLLSSGKIVHPAVKEAKIQRIEQRLASLKNEAYIKFGLDRPDRLYHF